MITTSTTTRFRKIPYQAPLKRITGYGLFMGVVLALPLWSSLLINTLYAYHISELLVRTQVIIYGSSILVLLTTWFLRRRYIEEIGWLFLLVSHAIWFALPALNQVLTPGLWFGDWIHMHIENADLLSAGTQISIFLVTCGIGYHFMKQRFLKGSPITLPNSFLIHQKHRLLVVLGMCLIGLVPYILFGGGITNIIAQIFSGRADKAWGLASDNVAAYEGNSIMTLFWLTRAILVASGGLAGSYLAVDRYSSVFHRILYALVFLLAFVLVYFDQGTRSIVSMVVLPVLTIAILRYASSFSSFSRLRLFSLGIICAISLLILTQYQMFYRGGTGTELADVTFLDLISTQQQADFFTETAVAVAIPQSTGFLYESPVLIMATNLIPRVLWSGKPTSRTMWLYTLYRRDVDIWLTGGNALPSIVGQYYMIAGILGTAWIGLLFGLLAGWLGRFVARNRNQYESVVFAISGLSLLFVSFRFLAPGYHYSVIALGLLLIVYPKLVRSRLRA